MTTSNNNNNDDDKRFGGSLVFEYHRFGRSLFDLFLLLLLLVLTRLRKLHPHLQPPPFHVQILHLPVCLFYGFHQRLNRHSLLKSSRLLWKLLSSCLHSFRRHILIFFVLHFIFKLVIFFFLHFIFKLVIFQSVSSMDFIKDVIITLI